MIQELDGSLTIGDALTPIQRRIESILRLCFAGDQSAMATCLGVSQSGISRVVRGERRPGPALLRAIGTLPGVRSQWLIDGEGPTPELKLRQIVHGSRIPLYRDLRFVLVDDRSAARSITGLNASSMSFSVSSRVFSPTRVAMRVLTSQYRATPFGQRIRAGDVLIFEINRSSWLNEPASLANCLCLVRGIDRDGHNVVTLGVAILAQGSSDEFIFHNAYRIVERFGPSGSYVERANTSESNFASRPLRRLDFDSGTETGSDLSSVPNFVLQSRSGEPESGLTAYQIVSVAVSLNRRNP